MKAPNYLDGGKMEQIIKQSDFIISILGEQEYNSELEYRLMHYILSVEVENGVLLRNQLTYEMILLNNTEYNSLLDSKGNELFISLVKKWFLVPDKYNEYKIKQQILKIMPLFNGNKGRHAYSILTTLDCNARCFYCFENDAPKYKMTDEVADNVIEYINNTCNNQRVVMQWFGGEPLYNNEIIDRIAKGVKKNGIDFISTMTTNGYLFDEPLVEKAKSLWNLKKVQITLDGTEKVYNKIKNYIYDTDCSPFQRVLHNIQLLSDAEIYVSIRLNIERHNIKDIYCLIDELNSRFKKNQFLNIYPALLFDDCKVNLKMRDEDSNNELLEESIKIKNKLFDLGYYKAQLDLAPKTNSCMADDNNTTIILPNGNFSKCERLTQENRMGNVYGATADKKLIESWKEVADFDECEICPIGIECRHLKKCPSWGHHGCGASTQKSIIISKKMAMKTQYNDFTAKQLK